MKKVVLLLLFFSFLFSCKKKKIELEKISREIMQDEYTIVYSKAIDSVLIWSKLELPAYDEFTRGFFLDSIICFNTKKDKAVMALSYQLEAPYKHDGMEFFYGAKIKDTWYFFTGAAIHLPREIYQKDVTKPLSFEKLHEIALKEVFSGYLKKKKTWKFWKPAEWEVNERFFDQICPRAVGGRHFGTFIHFEDAVKCSSKGKWVKDYEKELPECNKDPFQYPIFGTEGYYDFVYEKDLKWLIQKGYCDKNGQLIKKYLPKFNRP